jgi:hypothetical protein
LKPLPQSKEWASNLENGSQKIQGFDEWSDETVPVGVDDAHE